MSSPSTRRKIGSGATRRHFYVFVAFLLLVFMTGGSSRGDVSALLVLRPLAVLFGAYAIVYLKWNDIRGIGAPLWLLLSVICLAALQLVPLPPSIWHSLPGRELVVQTDTTLGLEGLWRPLTMSPAKTWNTLFSLLVPLAALLFYALLDVESRKKVWTALLLIGMLSAVWGMLQITGSTRGPFYLYKITNFGAAVGLFANRNHQGLFLACMIIMASWHFAIMDRKTARAGAISVMMIGSIVLFLLGAILTGSRAGLAASGLAVIVGLLFIANGPLIPSSLTLFGKKTVSGRWLVLGLATIFAVITVLAAVFSRALAIDRLIADDPSEELRAQLLPTFEQMISAGAPAGFGFGSFEFVYKAYEPLELLNPKYLNLAHNDAAQWIIEGGVPAILILIAFLVWLVRSALTAWRSAPSSSRLTKIMALFIIAVLLLGSIIDYPLRVPSLMVLFALLCARLSARVSKLGVP